MVALLRFFLRLLVLCGINDLACESQPTARQPLKKEQFRAAVFPMARDTSISQQRCADPSCGQLSAGSRLHRLQLSLRAAFASLPPETGLGERSDGGKEAAREGAARTLVRRFTRRRMSADVGDALLGFRLGSGLGLRGKR